MPSRIVFTGPHAAELQEAALPPLGPRSVLLRSRISLISTGTELTAFLRSFDAGTHWDAWVKYPFQPGYATVAEVESLAEGVRSIRAGQRVVARVPHASHHVVEKDQVTCVPDEIPDDEAAWFALAKIAFTGMLAADLRIGSRIVIVGAGPVGQMVARWAAASALADIGVIDRNENRLALARNGGATFAIAGSLEEKREAVVNGLGGHQPDVVFDCTGNPKVVAQALQLAVNHGKVVILGDTGFPALQHITSDVVLRGVSIVGAHDRHTRQNLQWNNDQEIFRLFFRLVSLRRFAVAGMVTHRFAPQFAQEAYLLAANAKGATGGIVFDWQSGEAD